MSSSRPLIHVGYPKTGSSWLQEVIFKDEKAGFMAPWGSPAIEVLQPFTSRNEHNFLPESVRSTFDPGLQEAARRSLVPVLSNEMLSGNPFTDKHKPKEVAIRLKTVFPDARLLICIREQKSLILSWFVENIKNGRIETLQQVIDTGRKKTQDEIHGCLLEHIKYDLLIESYYKIFYPSDVLVLPFELLKTNSQLFTETILNFAGSNGKANYSNPPKNTTWKAGRVIVQRGLNFFVEKNSYKQQPPLGWLIACKLSKEVDNLIPEAVHERIKQSWQELINEQVGDLFRNSNQHTSQLIGINLSDFGYDC